MANQDGTLDITEAVEAGRATLAAWSVDYFYTWVATIPAIGGFLVAVLKFFNVAEKFFGQYTGDAVMLGQMQNTILRKPAQATEFVGAVHKLKNLPEDVSDDVYEAHERNKGQYFKNLVRVTN